MSKRPPATSTQQLKRHKANPFEKYLKPEDNLHIQVCRYIKYQYPGAVIHHSPNEGKRTNFERFLMTVLEVSPGFPDLLIFWRGKVIALELKAGKNRPTAYQEAFIAVFNSVGIPAGWVTGFEAAKEFIDRYFK